MLGLALPAALRGPGLWAALALLAVAGAWTWLTLWHDPAIRAEVRAEIAAQTAERIADYQRAAVAALADAEAGALRRAAATASLRERIIHVPVATACADSAAIGAALGGLRERAGGSGAPAHPAADARLPARP